MTATPTAAQNQAPSRGTLNAGRQQQHYLKRNSRGHQLVNDLMSESELKVLPFVCFGDVFI